jgi:hypothetical protein
MTYVRGMQRISDPPPEHDRHRSRASAARWTDAQGAPGAELLNVLSRLSPLVSALAACASEPDTQSRTAVALPGLGAGGLIPASVTHG